MSFASILTGFLPHETKMILYETNMWRFIPLPAAVKTLPEILREHGYKTAAVISNYVLRRSQGFEQGFMIYDDAMNERELVRRCPERIAEHTTDRAIELLKQFCSQPLFMWIHYQDPHGPYAPPGRFAEPFLNLDREPRNLRVNESLSGCGGIPSYQKLGSHTDFHYYVAQYDGEIRYQDAHFKRLIDVLKELGLYDDALIIFSSDHGEGMGEHDYYFAHGEYLYSDQTHVPLIVKYGKELTGRRTDYVQHLDIVPTVLKIVGIETDPRLRGGDLLTCRSDGREIFAEMNSPCFPDGRRCSLVRDGFKLIYTPVDRQCELFNLNADPCEKHNIINDAGYRNRAFALGHSLERISREDLLKVRVDTKPRKLSEEGKQKLRSLGYVR